MTGSRVVHRNPVHIGGGEHSVSPECFNPEWQKVGCEFILIRETRLSVDEAMAVLQEEAANAK